MKSAVILPGKNSMNGIIKPAPDKTIIITLMMQSTHQNLCRIGLKYICCLMLFALPLNHKTFGQIGKTRFIKEESTSLKHYGNDKSWYLNNIPFFECADPVLEEVYYYRWQLYKAHLKNLGKNGYIVTEFLNTMGWDLKPYNSLNDATGFHIYEGRWLKNQRYVQDYINFMYKKGGNDRHFSEGIADAAYAYYLVNPDKQFITSQLPSMLKIYNAWYDHFDQTKKLYYIEPLLDATEYTISSIDASGGKDGFRGGDSFRPSINSYMYANALAINNIALLNNDQETAAIYLKKAADIKTETQQSLWNDSLHHFIDRYKVNNKNVTYWNYIRGRELVGFVPWTYNLPDDNVQFNAAWQHLNDTTSFKGNFGLRTNEPSYQYYMKQYRYIKETGERECQWNGPSWPFQTSQVLLGMANVLNNYHQNTVSTQDYLTVLKQYAQQHYQAGKLNIVEDYDPDKGGPIVNLNQRSEHYNHSEFNDLIITGLCGLRPGSNNTLIINPLIPANAKLNPIKYFCLQNVLYHGHQITVLYDQDGKKYHQGKGLFVYVDGQKQSGSSTLGKRTITIPDAVFTPVKSAINLAVNSMGEGFPKSSASYTDSAANTKMANDGRVWYFKDVKNRWSNINSPNQQDWYEIDFQKSESISKVSLYLYADDKILAAPKSYELTYWNGKSWKKIDKVNYSYPHPLANTQNTTTFKTINTEKLRVSFVNAAKGKFVALSELEIY